LWTANELIQLRKQVEAAGLKLEAIENFDPAPGTTFCSTAPSAPCTFATSTPF
jgi:mannonate dehydratase